MSIILNGQLSPILFLPVNLYETDELFKMYVAINSKKHKSKYIIGQHRNS